MAKDDLSFDDFDEVNSPRPETCEFDRAADVALNRRGFLGGVMAFGLGSFLVGTTAMTHPVGAVSVPNDRFGFEQITASIADTITVPEGFDWDVLFQWGDPLWSDVPVLNEATRGAAATQERAFGGNNDGMSFFPYNGLTIGAVNNEYTNRDIL